MFEQKPRFREVISSDTTRIQRLEITLAVDNGINDIQAEFVKNIVFRKAQINTLRGDIFELRRMEFVSNDPAPVADVVPEPLPEVLPPPATIEETLIEMLKNPWIWLILLLALLLFILLLWLILRKSPQGGDTAAAVAPPAPVAETPPPLSPTIDFLKQEIISLGFGKQKLVNDTLAEQMSDKEGMEGAIALYGSLGHALFRSLFTSVKFDDVARIREEAQNQTLEPEQIHRHLYSFYQRIAFAKPSDESGHSASPFNFLTRLNDQQIMYLVHSEETRVKALVLSQLPSNRSASIMSRYPVELQTELVQALGDFDSFPMETFRGVARRLAEKAVNVPSYENIYANGVTLLMQMLDNMDQEGETRLLNTLETQSPDTFYKIKQLYYTFEDLARTPANILANVLREFDRRQIAVALSRSDRSLTSHVLRSLPEKLRLAVHDEMRFIDKETSIEMIREARLAIVRQLRTDLKKGKFSMADLSETSVTEESS
jgi:flagellar motor switch protein FliG